MCNFRILSKWYSDRTVPLCLRMQNWIFLLLQNNSTAIAAREFAIDRRPLTMDGKSPSNQQLKEIKATKDKIKALTSQLSQLTIQLDQQVSSLSDTSQQQSGLSVGDRVKITNRHRGL